MRLGLELCDLALTESGPMRLGLVHLALTDLGPESEFFSLIYTEKANSSSQIQPQTQNSLKWTELETITHIATEMPPLSNCTWWAWLKNPKNGGKMYPWSSAKLHLMSIASIEEDYLSKQCQFLSFHMHQITRRKDDLHKIWPPFGPINSIHPLKRSESRFDGT